MDCRRCAIADVMSSDSTRTLDLHFAFGFLLILGFIVLLTVFVPECEGGEMAPGTDIQGI